MSEIEDWKSKYQSEHVAFKSALVDIEAVERSLDDKKKDIIRVKNENNSLKAQLKQEKTEKNSLEEKVEEYLDKERRALLKLNEYHDQSLIIKKISDHRDDLKDQVIRLKDECHRYKMKLSSTQDFETETKKLK